MDIGALPLLAIIGHAGLDEIDQDQAEHRPGRIEQQPRLGKRLPAAERHAADHHQPEDRAAHRAEPGQREDHDQAEQEQRRALHAACPVGPAEKGFGDDLFERLGMDDDAQLAIDERRRFLVVESRRAGADQDDLPGKVVFHLCGGKSAGHDFPSRYDAGRVWRCVVHQQATIAGRRHLRIADLERHDIAAVAGMFTAGVARFHDHRLRLISDAQRLERERGQQRAILGRDQRRLAHETVAIFRQADEAEPLRRRAQSWQRLDGAGIGRRAGARLAAGIGKTHFRLDLPALAVIGQEIGQHDIAVGEGGGQRRVIVGQLAQRRQNIGLAAFATQARRQAGG